MNLRQSRGRKFRRVKNFIFMVALLVLSWRAVAAPADLPGTKMHPMLGSNVARMLRYWPVDGDFVITNGSELFNRPLYCENSAFRIDAGDKPEFSFYIPGRGGNLRLGIKTSTGIKWLNDADEIVSRYRAGSMVYEIRDGLLTKAGKLTLTALPLSNAKGVVVRAELEGSETPVQLVFAFGGANGMRGKRGGDIGCESEPVSEFFQLHPRECEGNQFSISSNTFVLHSKVAVIKGIFPGGARLEIVDAMNWNYAKDLFMFTNSEPKFPVVGGVVNLQNGKPVYFAVKEGGQESEGLSPGDLPQWFANAEEHRGKIARQVVVETPDPFINAAVPALNIAADAIWDEQQQSFMHGAVAWRMRLAGWRGPYAGDALGWHDRTATHFGGFAREQNTEPVPDVIPPADFNLARNEAALHSNGDMTKSHYDMNLVLVDAFFRHLLWTGDTNYAAEMWPVIERHLAWERRLFRREFGPDKLPLYEGYAAIWSSDDLSYNGGGATHASAYNYFDNRMAAKVAKILGKDPEPYEREADLILRGMNAYLWIQQDGCFAEYKDYLGLQLTHPDPALWSFYTIIDSGAATSRQAAQMSQWVDTSIMHIPVCGTNMPDEGLFTLPTSNWMPYEWSLNNVVMAEAAHTALAYWEVNRPEAAFKLFKGELMLSMYQGLCPGNLGAMTSLDAARGEAQRDFGDAIGINARALVEGLFGVRPDVLDGELKVVPGFPENWDFAKISHPDFSFEFKRGNGSETFLVESKFPKSMKLVLDVPIFRGEISGVTVNGAKAHWKKVEGIYGVPRIEIESGPSARWEVQVQWIGGDLVKGILPDAAKSRKEEMEVSFDWNKKYSGKFERVNLTPFFNDEVGQIFKNEYREPRSPFCSLATPKQGIGGWCEPDAGFEVDDSGLRRLAAKNDGRIILPDGVSFETPTSDSAKNIIFTSQWKNYPTEASVPLRGKSGRAFLLMAGSSNPMQSGIDNGEVVVTYADGTMERLALRNPANWWPIDQDYFTDDFAFRLDTPLPPRVSLKTGRVRILDANEFKGTGGKVPGGAATVLELPLNPDKELKSITVRALANEVVIGLMAVTLERE
jgi:Domain of unknown function (DUF4450)